MVINPVLKKGHQRNKGLIYEYAHACMKLRVVCVRLWCVCCVCVRVIGFIISPLTKLWKYQEISWFVVVFSDRWQKRHLYKIYSGSHSPHPISMIFCKIQQPQSTYPVDKILAVCHMADRKYPILLNCTGTTHLL